MSAIVAPQSARCRKLAALISVLIRKQPYIRLVVADETQSFGSNQLHIRANTPPGAVFEAAHQLAELVRGLTNCAPLSVDLRYPVVDSTPPVPVPGANAGVQGLFIFETNTIEQYFILRIPGIKAEYKSTTEENTIDLTNPAIAELINAIINGVWSSKFGYVLTKCVAGIISQV